MLPSEFSEEEVLLRQVCLALNQIILPHINHPKGSIVPANPLSPVLKKDT